MGHMWTLIARRVAEVSTAGRRLRVDGDSQSTTGATHRGSFFFSSRRRHTRCSRDWSSDVCSSDLKRSAKKPRICHPRLTLNPIPIPQSQMQSSAARISRAQSNCSIGSYVVGDNYNSPPCPGMPKYIGTTDCASRKSYPGRMPLKSTTFNKNDLNLG